MAAKEYAGLDSKLTGTIIKCAIEVHRHFGCGLKEEAEQAVSQIGLVGIEMCASTPPE